MARRIIGWTTLQCVCVCVSCLGAVRDEERRLSLTALIGVQVNSQARLSSELVRRDALQQLRILEHELGVKAAIMLQFATPKLRTTTLRLGGLAARRTALWLMPWMRQVSASASKFMFRARVCIEGVPEHAQ